MRSHVGGAAAEASSALGARAFAVGDAVGFAAQPDLHTAAHEAAHVVQQQRGVALAGGVDTPGDPYERHADAVADAVVAGRSAESLLDAHAGSAGGTAAVQRDTKQAPSNATQPEDPPPARGTFRVEVAGAGAYTFVFNSADLRSGTSPAQVAFSFYMKDVFPGVTSGQIDAVFKSNHVFFVHGDQIPDGEHEYLVNVRPAFHNAIIATMKRVAPHLHVVEPQVGAAALPGAASAGGTGASPTGAAKGAAKTKGQLAHAGGDEHTDAGSTTVELDRALYDRLLKEFPEAVALRGPQAWPALLAFLADHVAELKQLPHTKTGVKSLSVAELEKLLEAFKQHQRQADTGDHNGEINGADEAKRGAEAGVDGGNANTQNTKGTKGGATEGEGDSKYGWVRWVPKGEIGVQPELPQYIAGSELKAKLQWDLSVHPDAGLVLLANHCRYAWIVKHNGKVVDGSSKAYLHDNREVYLDLDGGPGDYEITVTATSRHFKTEDHEYSVQHTVKAIAETDFDKQTFDAAQTGPDATFARDDAGKLHLNKDQQALTAAQEITTLDLTRGHVDELGKEGKITGSSQQALDDELDHERAALAKIQAKTGAGAPYVVRGTFVGRETSSSETLRLMMAMTERSQDNGTAKVGLLLHDITTGEPTRHPGDDAQPIGKDPSAALERAEAGALDAMADHFHAHNDYSKGTVHLAAQRLASDAVWEKTIETNNWRKKSTKVLHGVAMVGGALLMVVPGGQVVAVGVLLATTSVATAAALAIDIQDRVAKEGTLKFDRRLVMDLLQVATLVLPFGAMTKVLAEASQVAKTRFALSMVALDGAQGFVMAQDVRHQLILIEANAEQQLADATTDEERAEIRARRDQNVAQVLGGAVTSGAFMLVSMGAGLKHVLATSRAGRSFHVREPVAQLGEGPRATMEQTLTEGAFAHGEQHVAITPEERLYLEHQVATPEPKAASDAKPPADPHAKAAADSHDKVPVADESHKAPHERTTQKDVKAVDPNVDSDTGATGVTFQGRGDRIGALASKVAPEPGYFDVVVHGDGKSFAVLHDGEWVKITPNSVRKYIRAQKGYHGQPIRLLSCEAGAEGAITAQAVADGLDVHVKAATEKLWFSQDKTTGAVDLIIGNDPKRPSGGWAEFDPHGAKPTAPEPKAPVDVPTLPAHERATDRMPAQPDPTVDEHAAKPDESSSHEQVPLGKPVEPVPPKDAALMKAQSDDHVERVREETVQDAPEAETNRIKEAAYKKADETYQQSASQQRKPKDARKDASEAAKALAKTEWLAARERLTRDAADRMIDDGSVFDRSQMSDPAKQQLDAYRNGAAKGGPTEGAHAQRLATALPGNTVPAMESMLDAEAAAGNCRRDNERAVGRDGAVQIQPTYYFNDGSVIRIKPEGDSFNGWKPSFSVEVKNAGVPASAATEQADIAFKVDSRGRAVPKSGKEIANPYSSGKYLWQRDRFNKMIIFAGHQLAP